MLAAYGLYDSLSEGPLLSVRDLCVCYRTRAGNARAVDRVSFDMKKGEVLGIVGETGCGKSTLAHTIPRLLPEPPAHIERGSIIFDGKNLLEVPKKKMPLYRGTGISMIFQEPINSLNPAYRIYDQLAEAIRVRRMREAGSEVYAEISPHSYDTLGAVPHPMKERMLGSRNQERNIGAEELREEVLEFLKLVRINDPERILRLYPHELSGGMRQRVMIAMALSERPKLMIADEPTSALDVTIQAQVLSLMKDLIKEVNTSILFISHDLGVVAEIADRIGVMYAGRIVEIGRAQDIFLHPAHPYTVSLLHSFPSIYKSQGMLPTLKGSVPSLLSLPSGCHFRNRCSMAMDVCEREPEAVDLGNGHIVLCHFCQAG